VLPYNILRPRLRILVAGLSPWRPGCDTTSVRVGFVVDIVALRRGFLPLLLFILTAAFH